MIEGSDSGKITVIVPVYNVEKYLKECLDSIIGQSYTDLEIICVDDGSTDHSLDILHYYEKKDFRVQVLEQKNKGPAAARNLALSRATGTYISFVDSDDFLAWNAYEILVRVAEENESDLVIFGGNTVPYEGPAWIQDILNTQPKSYRNCTNGALLFHEKASRPFLWLHFLRRELLESPDKLRFDETMHLGEDHLLQFLYVPRAKNVIVIADKLYYYRIDRSGSLMQLYGERRIQKIETHFLLVERIIEEWKKRNYFTEEEDNLITWIINFLYFSIYELPMPYRKRYALRVFALIEKNELHTYLIASWEQGHYLEFQEWSAWSKGMWDEMDELRGRIEWEKYEIQETLRSRAFMLGRFLTKRGQRLELEKYYTI